MRLSALLPEIEPLEVRGPTDREVLRVCQDSREAGVGAMFFAVRGRRSDGHDFVPELRAEAVVVERSTPVAEGVTQVRVADTRLALARAAAALAGHPSRQMAVVGVTGTNGKTTSTYLIEALCEEAGWPVGVIGTTGNRVRGRALATKFTTPEAPQWQGLLAEMATAGCRVVAAEVSSIGLAARRVDATRFQVALYTNLSQDHLDFHGDMAAYAAAKARLFAGVPEAPAVAVLNAVDPACRALLPLPEGVRLFTFGLDEGDIHAESLRMNTRGSEFVLVTPAGHVPVALRLIGRHNVWNALGVVGVGLALGLDLRTIAAGLARLERVPGRLDPVDEGQDFAVLVDYAHTDDALRSVLGTLRELTMGRRVVVFGCGGDRDPGKRPLMARAASEGAELVIATNDNPRSEDPGAILADMRPGLRADALVIPDRAEAIRAAVRLARPGDVVLIAGKGHETTQEIGGVFHPFDDRAVAAAALRELR